jgi:HAD superfamily hydrolase (TIGR01509 family)
LLLKKNVPGKISPSLKTIRVTKPFFSVSSGKDQYILALNGADRNSKDFDRPAFFEIAERHWFEVLADEGIEGMPGVHALLDHLHSVGIPFALATNSDAHYAKRCLAAANLSNAFEVRVSRDQVKAGKPAPDLFLAAAERLGVSPSQCLVLEDSETGLLAARAAQTYPILIQQRPVLRDKLSPLANQNFPDLEAFLFALNPRSP